MGDPQKSLETVEVDLVVECGKCGDRVRAPSSSSSTACKFSVCKCDNRALVCLQNRNQIGQWVGAQDQDSTFVHILMNNKPALPRMTLRKWNQLQQHFKTDGYLVKKTEAESQQWNQVGDRFKYPATL